MIREAARLDVRPGAADDFLAAFREARPSIEATPGFLGLSLESVSRAAAELQRRGLIEFQGRHAARILDPVRLAKLAAAV